MLNLRTDAYVHFNLSKTRWHAIMIWKLIKECTLHIGDKPSKFDLQTRNFLLSGLRVFGYYIWWYDNKEMEKRIVQAKKIIRWLNSIYWSREITKRRKLKIYETMTKITLLYGAETWSMKQKYTRNRRDEKIFPNLKKRQN